MSSSSTDYVSRGGLKMAGALDEFNVDVTGMVCADLGCNVGGFTDCLLQRGAKHVHAVDTGYGAFAWKLRQDERVTLSERTNAMHLRDGMVPEGGVDLVVIDLGWTPQKHAIPAALLWKPKYIITLIKPHYESSHAGGKRPRLNDDKANEIANQVRESFGEMGVKVLGMMQSPIRGGKSKGKAGNIEFLAYLKVV